MRQAIEKRITNETQIEILLNLDGSGQTDIHTGIGFFEHMLKQIAVHGLFDVSIKAIGDLDVDSHHTIEDVGLLLGQAFDKALGDRKGIVRIAQAFVPMDDSLCAVFVDLSGRPYHVFNGTWNGENVGHMPVSMIEHFFYSLSMTMKANLHFSIEYGRNNHHKAEALYKALGRALMQASRIDPKRENNIPSSKGVL